MCVSWSCSTDGLEKLTLTFPSFRVWAFWVKLLGSEKSERLFTFAFAHSFGIVIIGGSWGLMWRVEW